MLAESADSAGIVMRPKAPVGACHVIINRGGRDSTLSVLRWKSLPTPRARQSVPSSGTRIATSAARRDPSTDAWLLRAGANRGLVRRRDSFAPRPHQALRNAVECRLVAVLR